MNRGGGAEGGINWFKLFFFQPKTNSFLRINSPEIIQVFSSNNSTVAGMVTIGNQLFLAYVGLPYIAVYNWMGKNYIEQYKITVPGLSYAWNIAASVQLNCLYICDTGYGGIRRLDLNTNLTSSWLVQSISSVSVSVSRPPLSLLTHKRYRSMEPMGF